MNYPLVTVFTLIYNTNPKYIIEAIESIRANNYPNLQHIIIDDCSTNPHSKETVKKWISENNYSCEFIEHEVNFGLCKTLNHVLELARGKYIFGCSDDIILSHKIMTEVVTLENLNNTYAATYSDAYLIDENGDLKNGLFINRHDQLISYPDDYIYNDLVVINILCAITMLWKTSYLREIGGYDNNLKFEDYDMHLRLFRKYKIKFIDEPLGKYREHSENMTNSNLDFTYDYFLIYKKHSHNKIIRKKIKKIKRSIISSTMDVNELRKYEIKFPLIVISFKKIKSKVKFIFSNLFYYSQ
jgi:GT2 family glycosyltransferase